MTEPQDINAKDEINRAICVLKARIEYISRMNVTIDEFRQYDALCAAIGSLEKWLEDDTTHFSPEIARQFIWFKIFEAFDVPEMLKK